MITFAEIHPELVSEWSPDNDLGPDKVSYGSNKAIIWNGACGHTWTATPKNRGNKHGCPYCSGNKVLIGFNDLKSQYPKIAREWSKSNNPAKPNQFTAHSNKRFTWKCRTCGNEWKAPISDRTSGHGCPYCTNERIEHGANDLLTLYPEIAQEWSPNNVRDLLNISPKSTYNARWVCQKCGHEWQGVVDARVKGRTCPVCKGVKLRSGLNDLATVHPRVLLNWDYDRNEISPDEILAETMQYAFWRDSFGHTWRAKISDRVSGKGYCPICSRKALRTQQLAVISDLARKKGLRVLVNDKKTFGILIDAYIPEKKAVILLSGKYKGASKRRQNAINWLCYNANIRVFRIMKPRSTRFNNCICYTIRKSKKETFESVLETVFEEIAQ